MSNLIHIQECSSDHSENDNKNNNNNINLNFLNVEENIPLKTSAVYEKSLNKIRNSIDYLNIKNLNSKEFRKSNSNVKNQTNFNVLKYLDILELQNKQKDKRKQSIRKRRLNTEIIENENKNNNLEFKDFNKKFMSNSIDNFLIKIKSEIKTVDVFLGSLIFLNIVITIIDNEIFIEKTDAYISSLDTIITKQIMNSITNRKISGIENFLRFLNIFIVIFAEIAIFFRYKLKIKYLKFLNHLGKYDNLITSGLIYYLIIEMIFIGVFFPPYLNVAITGVLLDLYFTYNYDAIFSIIIILKSYLILRVYSYFSKWTSEEAKEICKKYKISNGIPFALKAELKFRPFIILFLSILIIVALCAFALRTFEYGVINPKEHYKNLIDGNDLVYLLNCFWVIIITMVTVGYGDLYPRSHLGRGIVIIAAILGMLLTSLMIVSLGNLTEFTEQEKKAYNIIKKIQADDNALLKAGSVIGIFCKLRYEIEIKKRNKKKNIIMNNNNNNKENSLTKRFILIMKLKRNISMFKSDYRLANTLSVPVDEMLKLLEAKMYNDIKELNDKLNSLQETEEILISIDKTQKQIANSMNPIIKRQEKIGKYIIELNNNLYIKNLIKKRKMLLKKENEENNNDIKKKIEKKLNFNVDNNFNNNNQNKKILPKSMIKKNIDYSFFNKDFKGNLKGNLKNINNKINITENDNIFLFKEFSTIDNKNNNNNNNNLNDLNINNTNNNKKLFFSNKKFKKEI